MINKLYEKLKETDLDTLLITDGVAIDYLTGIEIDPGERMYVLVIKDNSAKLLLSKLFNVDGNKYVEPIYFLDTDDYVGMLKNEIKDSKKIGVDKFMDARFLLPIMDEKKEFVVASNLIDDIRAIKDAEEVKLMAEASRLNDLAMGRMEELLKEDYTEMEMRELLLKTYKDLGSEGFSFEPIVGYGKGSWDPHHVTDDSKKKVEDSIVVDIGCIKDGYCSDMTRTFFYKEASEEAKKIYETVKLANETAIKKVAPGVKLKDVDRAARKIIEDAGYGEYFTHRTGHFIGREVHEAGDVSQNNENICRVGNIFSIEPGIYVPGVCGVRIEDLVVVTEDGCQVLNKYPKDFKIIK